MRFSMPFQTQEGSREELCRLALAEGANRRQLCRRFNVQPRILYKWLERYRRCGTAGLADHSRRPKHSPNQLPQATEQPLVRLRESYPRWGARKIRRLLKNQGQTQVPACSCVSSPRADRTPTVKPPSRTGNASSVRCPIVFGRWTSKDRCPRSVVRPMRSPFWTITRALVCVLRLCPIRNENLSKKP